MIFLYLERLFWNQIFTYRGESAHSCSRNNQPTDAIKKKKYINLNSSLYVIKAQYAPWIVPNLSIRKQ